MQDMDFYQRYSELNSRLCRGESLFCRPDSTGLDIVSSPEPDTYALHYPRIGIYTGQGSSHSWLWFAELFDRCGLHALTFLNEQDIQKDALHQLDVLAISGGDTFGIASALNDQGAQSIKKFVSSGGLYLGSCAGAYLPLNSSKGPLDLFNFVQAKITNLSKNLPQTLQMTHKAYVCYGCQYLFHPVREEVALQVTAQAPFCSSGVLLAPLYGGPGMIPADSCEALALYSDFTEKTQYLVPSDLARKTLIPQAAIVRSCLGKGHFYLMGPHLEHPYFPEANKLILDCIYWETANAKKEPQQAELEVLQGSKKAELVKTLKRELSNSRIVSTGLELMPLYWMIGNKAYEPLKFRVFLESMWTRIPTLEKASSLTAQAGSFDKISATAAQTTILLRELKTSLDREKETTALAGKCFQVLQELAAGFFDLYFKTRSAHIALSLN